MSYASVSGKLSSGGTVILDGGVGTEVLRRTGRWVRNGIEASPETIREIHRDYIEAGADVITANTFQIARHTFLNFFHGLEQMRAIGRPGLENRAGELHAMAVSFALEARQAAGAAERMAVAGSISPLNHPFRSDMAPDPESAEEEHAETAKSLASAGVDFLLLETMNTLREAKAALRAAKATGLPVWVSLVPNGRGESLGGEALEGAAELESLGADAVLVNSAPPEHIGLAVQKLASVLGGPVGAYAQIGRYAPPSWKMDFFPRFIDCDTTGPEAYAAAVASWAASGARIVGGCCGTTPEHIRAVAETFRG